MINLTPANSA